MSMQSRQNNCAKLPMNDHSWFQKRRITHTEPERRSNMGDDGQTAQQSHHSRWWDDGTECQPGRPTRIGQNPHLCDLHQMCSLTVELTGVEAWGAHQYLGQMTGIDGVSKGPTEYEVVKTIDWQAEWQMKGETWIRGMCYLPLYLL